MVRTLAATVAARAFDVGVGAGVPAAELEAIFGVPRAALGGDARVNIRDVFACFARCMQHTQDPSYPLRVAATVTMEDYAVLGFAMMTSTCVDESFARLERYGHVVSDSGAWRVAWRDDGAVRLAWDRPGARTLGHRGANECAIAELLGGLRRSFGESFAPTGVSFLHPAPPDLRAHAAYFRAPIAWSAPWEGVELPASVRSARPSTQNPALSRFFAGVLEGYGPASPRCADRVRAAIARSLPSGAPSAAQIAASLGMSERSLRRALAAEETSFRAVLDDLRGATARDLFAAHKSVTEVAFLLGFSETSALSRAFRRWNGHSPRVARRAARPRTG
jgi:AraC-like DNA-binding protein